MHFRVHNFAESPTRTFARLFAAGSPAVSNVEGRDFDVYFNSSTSFSFALLISSIFLISPSVSF